MVVKIWHTDGHGFSRIGWVGFGNGRDRFNNLVLVFVGMKDEDLTEKIIGAFYKVYNSLGYGFLEKVYERALAVEFERMGLKFGRQVPVRVLYEDVIVGDYIADYIVEGRVVVEVKAIRELTDCDGKQLLNYLRVTGKSVGLLLNFGRKAEIKRKIFG